MANISNFFSKLLQIIFKQDIDNFNESLANNPKLIKAERKFEESVLELDRAMKNPDIQKAIEKGEILDPFKTMIYLKNVDVEQIKKKLGKATKSKTDENKRK